MNALLKMKDNEASCELYINDKFVCTMLIPLQEEDSWHEFEYEGNTYDLNFYEWNESDDNFSMEWKATIYHVIDGNTDTMNPVCNVTIDWSEVTDEGSY
jgi:hypothetical protein